MRHRFVPLSVLVSLALAGCGESSTPDPIPASVAVQLATAQLEPGDTTRATVKAHDATGGELPVNSVTYTSSDNGIARVDSTGKVTGLTEGSASIAANVRGVGGSATLTVSYKVGTVKLTVQRTAIETSDTTRITVAVLSSKGVTLSGRTATFSTSDAAVATVSSAGLVQGVSTGTATIKATVEGIRDSVNVTIQARAASVRASQDSIRLSVQGTTQLSAQAFDAAGNELQGRTVTWSSTDVDRASVSNGLVTWLGPGRSLVIATVGSVADTVRVSSAGDLSITTVHMTQGVQDEEGTIPLIAQGGAAAIQVLMSSAVATNAKSKVVLRLTDAAGALVFADTETTTGAAGPGPTLFSPAARFLVPGTHLVSGRRWQVLRDPMSEATDDDASNDVFPRAGPAAFALANVPQLNIRFVPITLSAHGGGTPVIGDSDLPGYLRTLVSVLPVGRVTATVGTALTSSANFGTPPSGGAASFWSQVLQELDAARVASSDPSVHWYGIVGPPTGFNFTQSGGQAFIPSSQTSTGSFTRSAVSVRTGWFSSPTQARDLVAHELAHNFGRRHAPCGNPGGPDPSFPQADGRIGVTMFDVYAWANGLTSTPQVVGSGTGDLMSYCFPQWSSVYTYRGVLDARGTTTAAALAERKRQREEVFVVQGSVSSDGTLSLLRPISLLGFRTDADPAGDYRLQGLDTNGRLLFEHEFSPVAVDHADVKLFTVALPLAATASRLHTLRVLGRGRSASLSASSRPVNPEARMDGSDAVAVSCADPSARLAVQDAITGDVLGVATGQVRLRGARDRALAVSCANGVMPRRALVRPQ